MASQDMLEALAARGPAQSLGGRAGEFGRLIGSWNVEVFDAEGDGAKRVSEGEWHFAWVLEGRAIQDVLVVPRRRDRHPGMPPKGNRYTTALRIFDLAIDAWRVFRIDPLNRTWLAMIARQEKDRLVSQGSDESGKLVRKTMFDLSDDAFRVREEASHDGGATWQTHMELRALRAA